MASSRLITTIQPCRTIIPTTRYVHTSPNNKSSASNTSLSSMLPLRAASSTASKSPLSILPTSSLLRSYVITRVTSSPVLLKACFAVLKRMVDPKAVILSPEYNPLLKWVFKHTFYAQFCAGESKNEVRKTIAKIKDTGYTGVILEYSLEVFAEKSDTIDKTRSAKDIEVWRSGMLETIDMASAGDFVGLKWSGLGVEALDRLNKGLPPTEAMAKVMDEVCQAAASKGVLLLPSSELEITNKGIHAWTLDLQRKYNKSCTPGKAALVYTTYQAYLRSAPGQIVRDLAVAQREGFMLGIKLVRGAYMSSEPKGSIWASKAETDKAYDQISEAVLKQKYTDFLHPSNDTNGDVFPDVALMMACHNSVSIQKAREIRSEQLSRGEARIDCAYAQLQGMADEISCDLVLAAKEAEQKSTKVDAPRSFKCTNWGTVSQCLQFLYRRAAENQDAAGRTIDTRKAMAKELWRRTLG